MRMNPLLLLGQTLLVAGGQFEPPATSGARFVLGTTAGPVNTPGWGCGESDDALQTRLAAEAQARAVAEAASMMAAEEEARIQAHAVAEASILYSGLSEAATGESTLLEQAPNKQSVAARLYDHAADKIYEGVEHFKRLYKKQRTGNSSRAFPTTTSPTVINPFSLTIESRLFVLMSGAWIVSLSPLPISLVLFWCRPQKSPDDSRGAQECAQRCERSRPPGPL